LDDFLCGDVAFGARGESVGQYPAAGSGWPWQHGEGCPTRQLPQGRPTATIRAKPSRVKRIWVSAGGLTSVADSLINRIAAAGAGGSNPRDQPGAAALHLNCQQTTPMAKIVDLKAYRARLFRDRALGPWKRRFNETYDVTCRLADLSDKTLLFLARPGDAATLAFYEIIMGTLDLGTAADFYALDKPDQLKVVDIHLFLADQTRFELMRRLGWVVRFACQGHTLVKLIQDADRLKTESRGFAPELSPTHPAFATFRDLTAPDKESFVRRLLSEALESFKNRVG
jgi:hypothetical protein